MSDLSDLDVGSATIKDKDQVGNTFDVLESGIYPFFVEEAYIETAGSGAMGIHLTLKENEDGTGIVLEKTVYVRSGNDKGNKSYYVDREGNQQPLPGLVTIDSLCKILTDKHLKEMKTEKMYVMVYDSDEGKRVNTPVQMLKALCGKPIYVAVQKQTVDKMIRVDGGGYTKNGETRDENEIMKFFRAKDKKSLTEIEAQNSEPAAFFHTWKNRWEGKVRDRSSASASGSAPKGAATTAGVKKMFGTPDA